MQTDCHNNSLSAWCMVIHFFLKIGGVFAQTRHGNPCSKVGMGGSVKVYVVADVGVGKVVIFVDWDQIGPAQVMVPDNIAGISVIFMQRCGPSSMANAVEFELSKVNFKVFGRHQPVRLLQKFSLASTLLWGIDA